MVGTSIETLEGLSRAVNAKRAVVCPSHFTFKRPRPAAFMINMAGSVLLKLFSMGMYIYVKAPDDKSTQR